MACGVHLGFLLICLVQAEHVRCLWATQAQSSQRQNSGTYVGFSQQDSGLRLGGSYPQNQLRQASVSLGSAQSSSLNTQTAVSSGYSQGLSSSGYSQTLSQPAQGGYASVRLVQSSSLSKPNWRTINSNQVHVPKRRPSGLSTSIASGSSVTKYSKGTPRTSKYLSSSLASVQSPSESYSFKLASHQSAAPAYYGQRGYPPSMKSSSLFSAGAPAPQNSVRMQTSATARARRVSSRHGSKASKPSHFSAPQNGRTGNDPGQTKAVKLYQSKLFAVNGGNAQESYKPTSTAYSQEMYSQSLPVSSKRNGPVGFQPRGLQVPSTASSLKASWNSRNSAQGAHNLPASGSGRAGTPAQRFAPTRTHSIPQRFGGSAIRRLREPADQKEVSIRKPQQTYTAPSRQMASLKPQAQSVHQESKWKRIRPHQGH